MPSGRHAGGGHSHRSGGSHSGSRGSSGSRRGPGPGGSWVGPHGSRIIIINGRYYTMPRRASLAHSICFILSFILLFASFFGFTFYASNNQEVKLAKKDYEYYQLMIDNALTKRANGDDSYIISVPVDHIEYHDSCGKWFLVYYIPYGAGRRLKGWTYDLYTMQEANAIKNSGNIEIALECPASLVNSDTDSVPINMPMDVNRDGDYIKANKSSKIGLGIGIASISGFVILLVSSFVIQNKTKQPYDANASSKTNNETNTNNQQTKYEDEPTYCQYCGARIKKGDTKCPDCGARISR